MLLRLSFCWHAAIHINSQTAWLTTFGWIQLASTFEFQRYIVFGSGAYNLVRFLVNSYWIIGSWWLIFTCYMGWKRENFIILIISIVLVCNLLYVDIWVCLGNSTCRIVLPSMFFVCFLDGFVETCGTCYNYHSICNHIKMQLETSSKNLRI